MRLTFSVQNFREAIKEAQEKWPIFATMLKDSEVTDEEEVRRRKNWYTRFFGQCSMNC